MELYRDAKTIAAAIVMDINKNGDVEKAWDYHVQVQHISENTYNEVVEILKGSSYAYNWEEPKSTHVK